MKVEGKAAAKANKRGAARITKASNESAWIQASRLQASSFEPSRLIQPRRVPAFATLFMCIFRSIDIVSDRKLNGKEKTLGLRKTRDKQKTKRIQQR